MKKISRSSEEIMNKAYAKDITLEEVKSTRILNLSGYIEDLVPIEILQAGDKIVVLKEVRNIRPGSGPSLIFSNGPIVISFYNHELKALKNTGLNKYYEVKRRTVNIFSPSLIF